MVPAILGGLIGAGASLLGGLFKNKAEKQAAEAAAKAAELNAQQIRERAVIESTLRERQGVKELGTVNAITGFSGLVGGSAADVIRESARNTAFDINTIEQQSELQAKALEQEAKSRRKGGNASGSAALAGGIADAVSFLR